MQQRQVNEAHVYRALEKHAVTYTTRVCKCSTAHTRLICTQAHTDAHAQAHTHKHTHTHTQAQAQARTHVQARTDTDTDIHEQTPTEQCAAEHRGAHYADHASTQPHAGHTPTGV